MCSRARERVLLNSRHEHRAFDTSEACLPRTRHAEANTQRVVAPPCRGATRALDAGEERLGTRALSVRSWWWRQLVGRWQFGRHTPGRLPRRGGIDLHDSSGGEKELRRRAGAMGRKPSSWWRRWPDRWLQSLAVPRSRKGVVRPARPNLNLQLFYILLFSNFWFGCDLRECDRGLCTRWRSNSLSRE